MLICFEQMKQSLIIENNDDLRYESVEVIRLALKDNLVNCELAIKHGVLDELLSQILT